MLNFVFLLSSALAEGLSLDSFLPSVALVESCSFTSILSDGRVGFACVGSDLFFVFSMWYGEI